jgi:tetratricopeptide (TPR) repeat protein
MLRFVSPLVLVIVLFTGACSRSASYYLNRGNQFAAQKKYADAELNYRKAIQKNASFGEAYYQLGEAQLKQGKILDAYRTLATTVKLMPDRDDVKVSLADLSFSLYVADPRHPQAPFDEATALSDQLLAKNPKSYDALRLKGELAAVGRKIELAEDFYRRANAIKPMQPDVILGLTQVLFEAGKTKEAQDLAQAMIDKDKTYGPIYDVLVRYRLGVKDLVGAEQILKAKTANKPDDSGSLLELAQFYAATSREGDMKLVLQRILDNPKAFADGPLQVGDFYSRHRRWDDARKQYEAGIQGNSGKDNLTQRIGYQRRIIETWLLQGKPDEAVQVVDEILKEQPGDEGATVVKASWLIASRNPDNISKAVSMVQPLATKNPGNATLHFTLGRALGAKGDTENARLEFLEAIKRNPNYIEPRLLLAEMGELKGDYQTALRYANEILAINPNLTRVRVLRAVSMVYTGSAADGRKELAALERSYPQDREIELQLGVLDLRDKQLKSAEDHFRKLTVQNTPDVRPLSGLAQTLAAEGELDKAVTLVELEMKKAPQNNQLRYLLGSTALMAGKFDLAIEQFQQLSTVNPKSAPMEMALGNAYRLKGDPTTALAHFQKASALASKDAGPLVAQAEVLTLEGHPAEALTKYRNALQLVPNNPVVLNNVAFLLADSGGSLDEALKLARRSLQLDSKQPRYSDTLGWIYLKQNLNDSAVQVFRGLTQSNPDNPTFHYHLAMALLQKGDKTTAKTELRNALAKKPSAEVKHNVEMELQKLG